jgi:branched-chain amino acid transport system ATP-binding protein
MAEKSTHTSGYGLGSVDSVMSVDAVEQAASELAQIPSREALRQLVKGEPLLEVRGLVAGYGRMEILHGLDLIIGKGQSLCLIGPNGAGKSTVLHSIFGFAHIMAGHIYKQEHDITRLNPEQKLRRAGIAYILQDNSVFPQMSVTENLLLGGYLLEDQRQLHEAVDQVLVKYPRLAQRRKHQAGNLSGGERRLLEISRALIMNPDVLLVDEPSIGLEPRYINDVFAILSALQHDEGKSIIMVEQNAKKGLEFADIGYVLVSGQLALAGTGKDLLDQPEVGRLFLGG